jgi:hypothetical protein
LDSLLTVVARNDMVKPVGAAMDNRVFNAYSWGERNFLTGANWDERKKQFTSQGAPSRVYHVPFLGLVAEALHKTKSPDIKVHFVMDEQKTVAAGLAQIWAYARGHESELRDDTKAKMGDLTWGNSCDHEGIQAADLLAHAWLGWYWQRENLAGDRRKSVDAIHAIHRREPGLIRPSQLEAVLTNGLSPEDRELVRAAKSPAERQKARRS